MGEAEPSGREVRFAQSKKENAVIQAGLHVQVRACFRSVQKEKMKNRYCNFGGYRVLLGVERKSKQR